MGLCILAPGCLVGFTDGGAGRNATRREAEDNSHQLQYSGIRRMYGMRRFALDDID